MPSPRIFVPGTIPAPLEEGIAALQDALGIPADFPADCLEEANAAAARADATVIGTDMTDVPFITIDPESSMDLDQAMHIERAGDGFVVKYAIANVAAWAEPGGALDDEAHLRGCTYYAPDNNATLYPTVLSHGAASLLADGHARPAYVWQMELDATGTVTATTLTRAMVKNTAKLSYVGCQADLDAGKAHPTIELLREVGQLRERLEVQRGGVSLPIPEQEIESHDGAWTLQYRTPLPIEGWNAQISLMTGMEAARLMLGAKVGILRTLPPADAAALNRLRRAAKALHIDWPKDMAYPEFLRTLDPEKGTHKAMLNQCTTLFRGAGYVSFDGVLPAEDVRHNALATTYAHTTAPLRRLVDRYVLEICACISSGEHVPDWCTEALDALPMEMEAADKREKKYERGLVDLVEALVLSGREGQTFHATVLEADYQKDTGVVLLADPAVEAPARGYLPFGGEVDVVLDSVDVATGKVSFTSGDGRPRGGGRRDRGRGAGGAGRQPQGGGQGGDRGHGNDHASDQRHQPQGGHRDVGRGDQGHPRQGGDRGDAGRGDALPGKPYGG